MLLGLGSLCLGGATHVLVQAVAVPVIQLWTRAESSACCWAIVSSAFCGIHVARWAHKKINENKKKLTHILIRTLTVCVGLMTIVLVGLAQSKFTGWSLLQLIRQRHKHSRASTFQIHHYTQTGTPSQKFGHISKLVSQVKSFVTPHITDRIEIHLKVTWSHAWMDACINGCSGCGAKILKEPS